MNAPSSRDGVVVDRLSNLTPVEAGAVLYLRLWGDGVRGRVDVVNEFDIAPGSVLGCAVKLTLTRLCSLCAQHGRRPLV